MLKVNKKVFSMELFIIATFIVINSINKLEHLCAKHCATDTMLYKDFIIMMHICILQSVSSACL